MSFSNSYDQAELIGQGTYAKVYRAVNTQTGMPVALKHYRGIPAMQLGIQQHLAHRNIASVESICEVGDTVVVAERLMDFDLRLLSSRQNISPELLKSYAYQLLSAIEYLHSNNIVHCAIYPENVLLGRDGSLVLSDFITANQVNNVGNFLCPLWYRPPEVTSFCGVQASTSMDIWSAGCVIAEMANKRPLFMCDTEQELNQMFSELAGSVLADFIICNDAYLVDLLTKMINFNPEQRISASEALQHPYFQMH